MRLSVNRRYIYIISNNYEGSLTNEKQKTEKEPESDRAESSSAENTQMLRMCVVSQRYGHSVLSVPELRQIQERLFSRRGKTECSDGVKFIMQI